jgi:hypothetical protein
MSESPESPGGPEAPTGPTGGAEPPAPPPPPPAPGRAAADYPVRGDVDHQPEYRRLLPLVKWFLAIPHYIVLVFLFAGAFFAILFAAFAVLFTRRYPEGLFGFVAGVYRWTWRLSAYLLLMADPYPPFSLGEEPEYPARIEIGYPGEMDRWRPFVQWLLAIPYLLVANILQNLAWILAFFAFFTILFTKRFPEGMFRIAVVSIRWTLRGNAYAHFLVTRYPPFVWA